MIAVKLPTKKGNAGEIMGIQNSARSVGMVFGSLLAGFLIRQNVWLVVG